VDPFLPFTTARLRLRAFAPGDAAAFSAYRSDPDVARYQSWQTPYALDRAERFIAGLAGVDRPLPGEWLQIAAEHEGVLVGDIAVQLDADGEVATVGYTLATEHQHRGFAVEAVGSLVGRLFDELGVHRVVANLDPRNLASARLLESLGFEREAEGSAAVRVGDEWVDDVRYAHTADSYAAWTSRPRTAPADVRLIEITPATARAMLDLRTHPSQRRFVAPVADSYADALFPDVVNGAPVVPRLRAIEADGELVGFLMIAEATAHHPEPYLWRLLVDRRHQRRGIGARALGALVEGLRAEGHATMLVNWNLGPGTPEPFYLARGFVKVRDLNDVEVEGRLTL
jgi:RimJ/RimL family protein N-acetyltransferase